MEQANTEVVIIISTIIVILITGGLIFLFSIFQKRKNFLLADQAKAKEAFEKAIIETQIEIREETLRSISWELHDNIGQLLTLAKIQLQNANESTLTQVSETLTKGLNEVRALSKIINPDAIKNINLKDALQLEIDRYNRLNFIEASLRIEGNYFEIDQESSIILFRILQEFFSNTIKHSKSKKLEVLLNCQNPNLSITALDDGIGFDTKADNIGIGLMNMQSRAKLIGANFQIQSQINNGTILKITYKNG